MTRATQQAVKLRHVAGHVFPKPKTAKGIREIPIPAWLYREAPSFTSNEREAQPAWHTDRFNDLLTETIKAARRSRRKRVNKFETAFVETLRAGRRAGRIPRYAPDWTAARAAERGGGARAGKRPALPGRAHRLLSGRLRRA